MLSYDELENEYKQLCETWKSLEYRMMNIDHTEISYQLTLTMTILEVQRYIDAPMTEDNLLMAKQKIETVDKKIFFDILKYGIYTPDK